MTKKVGKDEAIFYAKKVVSGLVFNMSKLEGNPYTFPQVQTLLEGITIGGHSVSDQQQVLRIKSGWDRVIDLVESEHFQLDASTAIELNTIIARNEALRVDNFRDGFVGIAGTDYVPPEPDALPGLFAEVVKETETASLPVSAYRSFLDCARQQYFWDGNKRTGQLLMNGLLLSEGYLPVSIPAKVQLEYNEKMLQFYDSGLTGDMEQFLSDL